MRELLVGTLDCSCQLGEHSPKLIALTGGPGGGKTAVLEMASRMFCEHVAVLPEAAGIVFGGGFPRHASEPARRAAQRAIYHIQREVERLVQEEKRVAVALCDRGTVDGLAYWPGDADSYFATVNSSLAAEIERYTAVIHLETPGGSQGYDHSNALRIESAMEAKELDRRILEAWNSHPRRHIVSSSEDFLTKASEALHVVRIQLPACCHSHPLPPRPGRQ